MDISLLNLQSDPTLATRHAAFFAARAQALSHRQQSGEQQSEALAWFGPEQENLRAALAHTEPHDPSLFLPLALAMGRFWELQGAFSEAVVWLERALAHAPDGAAVERSQALSILGNIANSRGDYAQAEALHTQCLALREASRDEEGVAMALQNLGLIAAARQDYPTANSLYERAIAAHQRVGNALDAASTQVNQANLRGFVGDWAGAEALYRETLSVLEAHDHRRSLGIVYANLCACVANRGEFEEAERFAQRSVSLKEALGDSVGLAQSLDTLAEVQAIRGSDAEACQTQRRSIALLHESTAWRTLPYALFHLAILLAESTPSQAAQLLGAARQQNQQQGITPPPYQQESYQALETRLEAVLGPSAFAQSHTAGGLLSRDETVSLALTTP